MCVMVKRYDIRYDAESRTVNPVQFPDGPYVKHTDHAALLEAAKLLVEAMEEPKAYESAMNNPIAKALLEGREP